MLGWQQNSFQKSFKINSDGISEFTMEQIQAKAATMGLTEGLTAQAVAMANDADFTAKAKTGKLKWGDAIKDSKIDAEDLAKALEKKRKAQRKAIRIITRFLESRNRGLRKYR